MNQTTFNLGDKVLLKCCLSICVKGNGYKKYYTCHQYWNPKGERRKVIGLFNTVIIDGESDNLKIAVKERNSGRTVKPFLAEHGVKNFSSKEVLTVTVENSSCQTTKIFTVFRTRRDDNVKVLNVKSDSKDYVGNFSQKLDLAPAIEEIIEEIKGNSKQKIKCIPIDKFDRNKKTAKKRIRSTQNKKYRVNVTGMSAEEAIQTLT